MEVLGAILVVTAIALGWWTFKHKVDIRRPHSNNWSSARWIPAVLAVCLAVGGVFAMFNGDGDNHPASADNHASVTTTSTTDAPKAPISQEVIDALTVTSASVGCPDVMTKFGGKTVVSNGQTLVAFDIGALKGTPPRLWSDAVNTQYTDTMDAPKTFGETQASVCYDVLEGGMVANKFARWKPGGVDILALNPWLQPFAVAPKDVNKVAATYVPLLDVKNPTEAQQQQAVAQNLAYQELAAKLNTLLTRLTLAGFKAEPSVENYHLAADGLMVGGLPQLELRSKQEDLKALQLYVTEKGECVPIAVIGFNVGDKRMEEFTPPTCETSNKPGSPSTTSPSGGTGGPTTKPSCQHDCSTTTTSPTTSPTTAPPTTGRKGNPANTTAPATAPPTQDTQPTVSTTPATSPTTVVPPYTDPAPTSVAPTTRATY